MTYVPLFLSKRFTKSDKKFFGKLAKRFKETKKKHPKMPDWLIADKIMLEKGE